MKKAGKNEYHLWEKRDLASSRQKELNLVRLRIQYAKTKLDCIAKNYGSFVTREKKKK
ncbi:hypothetical protein CXB51_035393 [Gossypium anomalum]|uniref:Uncharacterized protein n=1 Tax=Gossypium anomalum TaxID=47600 RepID=A0A8J5Y0W4_9ROSI|nr:hypothetical protein CXB51_035393 [Gossypium anomalum]